MRALAVTLATVLAATPPGRAQAPPAPPTIPVLAAEVAVDFVVRDEKGRIVRDLKSNALLALVKGLKTLPGRKAVVFFTLRLVLSDGRSMVTRSADVTISP